MFQASRLREALYLSKVLQEDPDNLSAKEMMDTIQKMDRPDRR